MNEHFEILGVKISSINLSSACRSIEEFITQQKKAYVCVAPVATIMECQNNEYYRQIINQADLTTPDGMPVVWLGKLKGQRTIDRTYGPDLTLAMCAIAEQKNYRLYFYGGTREALDGLISRLQKEFPGLNIVGAFSPPFRNLSEVENEEIIRAMNQARPDIIWVGLGAPKQDIWMYENRAALNAPVLIGVGAAFDFLSGTKKQAPRWMQRSGLEWVFRLACEPRRLAKRYLVGNTRFVGLLAKQLLQKGMI